MAIREATPTLDHGPLMSSTGMRGLEEKKMPHKKKKMRKKRRPAISQSTKRAVRGY